MLRLVFALSILLACTSVVQAQERTMKSDAPGTLRVWPQIGHWQVVLFRGDKGPNDLICLLGTAVVKTPGNFSYLWGIVERNSVTGLIIDDKNKFAVSGNNISVVVDGVPIGTYPITKHHSNNVQKMIISELSNSSALRIESLFVSGGKVEFKTGEATYSESLSGAGKEINNFHDCVNELGNLIGK